MVEVNTILLEGEVMNRYIDADALESMTYEVFGADSDPQKWDSGRWVRYKLFETFFHSQRAVDAVEGKGTDNE